MRARSRRKLHALAFEKFFRAFAVNELSATSALQSILARSGWRRCSPAQRAVQRMT